MADSRRWRNVFLVGLTAAWASCNSSALNTGHDGAPAAQQPTDAAPVDGAVDAQPSPDAATPPDGDGGDGLFQPPPGCSYWDEALLALSCDGQWSSAWDMQPLANPEACPPYVRVGDLAFVDAAAAAGFLACDTSCIYRAGSAVLVVYCGSRGEIAIFVDGVAGQTAPAGTCPRLLHYDTVAGSGWTTEPDAWEAEHPCP